MVNKQRDSDQLPEPLNTRELEILECLINGQSNREIAAQLHLAYRTVKWYNTQIYSKLSVNNRDSAVERAKELGLLESTIDEAQFEGKHNLPEPVTEFVGRKQEIIELQQLVDSKRLVTILAPGGMGKTRLSQAVAWKHVGHYRDGVYFVPLAPLTSSKNIVTTLAENIGFVFHGENPPPQQLVNFLIDRAMLLVLDNFEHLLEGVGLVSDIIQSTSNIQIIVTSRERLNLRGETVYSLGGLDFPTWETPEDALEYDAVKLFMQSANRVRSDFELQTDDLDFLARICRLTAGMPLGIELAAGWVDVLSLEKIAAEIQQGIDILETDMHDVPERHRSLRATFEQTWKRLTKDEQTVFARLSVFRGGFSLESAEAVAEANARHLKKLTQKTLIQTDANKRFAVHELLRQFGEGKLADTDEHPVIQAQHATFFADFMAERKQDIKTKRELEALELIESDFENVRVAWLYLTDQGHWEQLVKFVYGLLFYCNLRMRGQDALDLSEYAVNSLQAVPLTDTSELTLGRVLGLLGWAYGDVGLVEKIDMTGRDAIRMIQQFDDAEAFLETFHYLFRSGSIISDDYYLSNVQKGLRMARSIGDNYWEFEFQSKFARLLSQHDDFAEALQAFEQAQNILPDWQERWTRNYLQMALAYFQHEQYDRAKHYFEKYLALCQRYGNMRGMALIHVLLGDVSRKQNNFNEAYIHVKRSLQFFIDAGYQWIIPFPLQVVAQLLTDQNQLESAVEVLGTTNPHLINFMNTSFISTHEKAIALCEKLKKKLEPARFDAAWQRGQERELSTLVVELLSGHEDS